MPNTTEHNTNSNGSANLFTTQGDEMFDWDDHQVIANMDPTPSTPSSQAVGTTNTHPQSCNQNIQQWAMPDGPTQPWHTAYDNPDMDEPVVNKPIRKQPKKCKREEEMVEPGDPNSGRGRCQSRPTKRADE